MVRYTTPELNLEVIGHNLTSGANVKVTIKQKIGADHAVATISNPTLTATESGTLVTVKPTQAQTGEFVRGWAYVQVNWITSNGTRLATELGTIEIVENLIDEVITYGG